MIKDPASSAEGEKMSEGFEIKHEDFFLDGPVTRRVAILDFDDKTGELRKPVAFVPAPKGKKISRYDVDTEDIFSDAFIQTSVFATVLRTMYLFERTNFPDHRDVPILGRKLVWAFDAPQLLVVPRAGQWANAFYERESHSLQFFYIPDPNNPQQTVFTCLSRDIVAHETGHAILDGIAPDLYDNLTPQSLAMHEAIADLTALFMAFSSRSLTLEVLDKTDGSIEQTTAFSSIAEQVGRAIDPTGRAGYLRPLFNQKTLNPKDESRDEEGKPNFIDSVESHELSEVLSGALYSVMVDIHNEKKVKYSQESGMSDFSASGKALAIGAEEFRRMIFRGLDYMPPGDASFADLARGIIAAEQTLYPDDRQRQDWIKEQFVNRLIVEDASELDVETDVDYEGLKNVDIGILAESDWAAYEFANNPDNRRFLRIPDGVSSFVIRPRLDVKKPYIDADGNFQTRHECLFKVFWNQKEDNPKNLLQMLPKERQVTMGTTLAIDWDTKKVIARLTTDQHPRQKKDRDRMLERMVGRNILKVGAEAIGPDGKPLCTVIRAEVADGVMRVRETARMLHIAQGDQDG
jgi:hypothetical protein